MSKLSKTLVTGAGGQVGKEIASLNPPNTIFTSKAELDITNAFILEQFLKENKVHTIINCAAYTAVDQAEREPNICRRVNIQGVQNLVSICKASKIKLIHLSSDYVYNPVDELPISETNKCSPEGVYASSKYEGDMLISSNLSDFLILRTSWVYSSFGHNFVKTMLRLGKEKDQLKIVDDQIGSPTYARDLALTLVNLIPFDHNQSGIYNYSNLGFISWADFAEKIFELQNYSCEIQRIPTSDYPTLAPRPLNSRLIKSKIADQFDVHLKYWQTSLKNCLKEIDNSKA